LRWLCLDASAIDEIDYSAAETVRSVHAKLKARGIRVVAAEIMDDLKGTGYRFRELFGADAFYEHLEDVVKAYRQDFDLPVPSSPPDSTAQDVKGGA